jgi:hypothetical protein
MGHFLSGVLRIGARFSVAIVLMPVDAFVWID